MTYDACGINLLSFRIHVGIHWRTSLQQCLRVDGSVGNIERQATCKAGTPGIYRTFVGFDPKLLG